MRWLADGKCAATLFSRRSSLCWVWNAARYGAKQSATGPRAESDCRLSLSRPRRRLRVSLRTVSYVRRCDKRLASTKARRSPDGLSGPSAADERMATRLARPSTSDASSAAACFARGFRKAQAARFSWSALELRPEPESSARKRRKRSPARSSLRPESSRLLYKPSAWHRSCAQLQAVAGPATRRWAPAPDD